MLSFLLGRLRQAKPRRNRRRPLLALTLERARDRARPSASVTSDAGSALASTSACFGHEATPRELSVAGPYFLVDVGIRARESWSAMWSERDLPLIDDVDVERFMATAPSYDARDASALPLSDDEIMRYLDQLNQCIVEALNCSYATGLT